MTAFVTVLTVLCLRQLVTSLSPIRPELDPWPGHVRFTVESGAVTGVSPCTWFPPVSVVVPVLYNHLYLNPVLIRWLIRQSLGTFERCTALCDITERWTVKYFHSVSVLCDVCALGDETVLIESVHCQVWAEAEATVEHWTYNKQRAASWQQSVRLITRIGLNMLAV